MQEDRQLRLSTLQCLGAIVEHADKAVPDALFAQTLQELTPMIGDADLQVGWLPWHWRSFCLSAKCHGMTGSVESINN